MSSGVWAGEIPLKKAHDLPEVGGGKRTVKQELKRIGYLGEMEASYKALPIGVSVPICQDDTVPDSFRLILNCTLVRENILTPPHECFVVAFSFQNTSTCRVMSWAWMKAICRPLWNTTFFSR